jgi:hypothetical protein
MGGTYSTGETRDKVADAAILQHKLLGFWTVTREDIL